MCNRQSRHERGVHESTEGIQRLGRNIRENEPVRDPAKLVGVVSSINYGRSRREGQNDPAVDLLFLFSVLVTSCRLRLPQPHGERSSEKGTFSHSSPFAQ